MSIDDRMNHVADRYRAQGYKVIVRPGPDDLPEFAKDFNVEIIARRDDGSVLASAKKSRTDLEADLELPRYVQITEKQPGWRFDVSVLPGPESQPIPEKREAKEPSEDDIRRAVGDVESMLQAGFVQQVVLSA
jgi:REase_AHJR-like